MTCLYGLRSHWLCLYYGFVCFWVQHKISLGLLAVPRSAVVLRACHTYPLATLLGGDSGGGGGRGVWLVSVGGTLGVPTYVS